MVRARRRTLAGRARGRVLDLGGAESHRNLWPGRADVDDHLVLDGAHPDRLAALAADGQRFDTIVSVFQLAAAADLATTVAGLRALLAPEGTIEFLEPGRQVGVGGRAQRLVAPPLAAATGWRIDRDIPAELRAGGLSVIDLERHRVRTLQWWLRSVAEGTAHHALPALR